MTEVADQRERDAIRDDVHENMCVEAGAGTGKTTVLVDRIVRILSTGHADVRELVVITFTEKAAAELAARVRQGLEAALRASDDVGERSRLEAALRGLNQAHIETIHAFASAMLRERPVEAALDPGFEVMDVMPAQLEFEAAYDEWLTVEMTSDPPAPALADALNLGLHFPLVREAAEHLHRHRDLLPLAHHTSVHVDPIAVVDAIGASLAVITPLLGCAIDHDDGAYKSALAMQRLYVNLSRHRDDAQRLCRAIAIAKAPNPNAGNQGNWRNARDCKQVKDELKRIRALLDDTKDALRQRAIADLLLWLQEFVRGYEDRRKRAGKADFDDLLIWARQLVRDDRGVRQYFQSKFRCVLVDEFQDTDPLQAQMIVSLCAEGEIPEDWRQARLRPGSLFVVGDPKQSIYRFRRADIEMYDTVKRHVFGGEPRQITQNFRSARPLIEWVNAVFGTLIVEEENVQPRYIDLVHLPAYESAEGVSVVRAVAKSSRQGKAPNEQDIRRCEATTLAALIRDAVDSGAWLLRGDGDTPREAGYRDIVVIIPTRTDLDIYEEALALAGVPYRHEGGRSFFTRQEVRELTAVLRAIDDPGDAVAAVAALRSAAFGCSDEELLLHVAAGGKFEHASVRDELTGPVADSLRALRDLARLRRTKPLPDIVRAVLDRTRLVEFAMLQPQGDQIAANLLKVIDQARTFAEAGGGLRGFVRWLKENMTRTADEADAPISEDTDDVVRILTIHAAKGLEFPVVVFANMNTDRFNRTRVIADRAANRLHLKLGKREDGFRTPGYDDAEAREDAHTQAEERRLLYVAATRAKDRLIVPFIEPEGGEKSHGAPKSLNDWLKSAGAAIAPEMDIARLPAAASELPVWRRAIAAEASSADADGVAAERAAWIASHEALIAGSAAPLRVLTASGLKPDWERPVASEDNVRRGRSADFGSAVHAVIERAGLRGERRIGELAGAAAAEFGQQGRESEMEAIARRALASPAVVRARASKRALQEAPFTAPLPQASAGMLADGIAEGRIDLLFEEDGAIVVVDFKTDAVKGAEIDRRAAVYRNQALVYAWAGHAATGMPVREVIFVFAAPGEERAFAADAAFMTEAGALMRGAVAAATA